MALLLAVALVFAACGSDDDDDAAEPAGGGETKTEGGARTASFRGVEADTIKLGVVMVDYDSIKQFVDFNRGDQQKVAQALIDDMNAKGGVGGRKIVPVFKPYAPLGSAKALEVCTSLTEDEKVFATIGVFIDFSGDAQLCLARDHETIHIGHELRKPWIDDAPPGLLLMPDITPERRAEVLLSILEEEETLKGKKVAVIGDQDVKSAVDGTITPGLKELKLETGSTAILNISGPDDTPAALAQLDSFIERWKSEGVDAVVMSGFRVSAKQYVTKLKGAMPNLLLLSDQPAAPLEAAQDAVTAKQTPNPYEGLLTAEGETASERWKSKSSVLQGCVDAYEKASGQKVVGPDELTAGPDGKRVEIYIALTDFCGELDMFKQIAEKAGANLTNESWTKAVDGFGSIKLVTTDFASLQKGKYDADDGYRLVKFDSKIGAKGDWAPVTEILDVTKD